MKKQMDISDLLDLGDMGALSDWIIENNDKYLLIDKPKFVTSLEEIPTIGEKLLCWDSCEWHIDQVLVHPDTKARYMEEGTEVECYMPLPKLILDDSAASLSSLLDMDMGEAVDWIENNAQNYILLPKYEFIDSPEDVSIIGEEILCLVEPEWVIDYVEVDPEHGGYYMANGTLIEAYMPLPNEP